MHHQSRRSFVDGIGRSAVAAALGPLLDDPMIQAEVAAVPDAILTALNRMAYGPSAADLAHARQIGLDAYIAEQLSPDSIDDSACDAKLTAVRMRTAYAAGTGYVARNEVLPLDYLSKTTTELWNLRNWGMQMAYQERMRPWYEVRAAAWVRALYSKRQLREVMADFWHNHFNVNPGSDAAISVGFPEYDRIIRANSFGNFRTFLEAIAKTPAMLYFLDNYLNEAGGGEGGNENYARELFELHALGSDNYLKFYDDRTAVGMMTYGDETFVRGYIDDDVYEAARCLTGWTVDRDTGAFVADLNTHDSNQKIVLDKPIKRSQGVLKDGQDVFDMLANHPGTARTICTKLCRRLIADEPPTGTVDAAVATWMANRSAPDQIKKVLATILASSAFRTSFGLKAKRPFEFVTSFLRATGGDLVIDDSIYPGTDGDDSVWGSFAWSMGNTGHRLFEWPTPTGHPDRASYWLSTNGMLQRWNFLNWLQASWGGHIALNLRAQTNAAVPGGTVTAIVDYWLGRLLGYSIAASERTALIEFFAQGGSATQPPKPQQGRPDYGSDDAITERIDTLVFLIAMSPAFQQR